MTKEELKLDILREFGLGSIPNDENVTMYLPAILSAMDKYADQSQEPKQREVSEAIEFAEWIGEQWFDWDRINEKYYREENYYTIQELYDLFKSTTK